MDDLPFMTPSAQRLELRRADEAQQIPFWPSWMRTRWGAWLARHWKPARYRWRAEVMLALHREEEAREAAAALEAMVGLQLWAEQDFPENMGRAVREELIAAWCKWRTYHERKCERVGCTPIGSMEWLESQQASLDVVFRKFGSRT